MRRKDPNWVALIVVIVLILLIVNPGAVFTFLGLVYYIVLITLGIVLILLVVKQLSK